MSLNQRLDIRQSQSLVMTPQLQQAIKLLQMSNLELGDFVAEELEKNPLLERDDGNHGEDTVFAEDFATEPEILLPSEERAEADPHQDEAPLDTDFDNVWASDGIDRFRQHSGSFHDDGEFSFEHVLASDISLREHLLGQMQIDIADPAERMIGAALIELIDDAGYLPADLELARVQLGATPEQFAQVIERLQHFDPPGIFARSLSECLALQLRERNRLDPAMRTLLDHLDLVAKRDRAQLMKLCGVDAEDLAEMLAEIKALHPKPALAYAHDVATPVIPDVILRPQPGGGWHVELNSDTLPRVLVNERYYAKVSGAVRSKQEKSYLSEHWQQANWLIKALHQRATTILKTASEIVRRQDAFFVHGVRHLKPLILRDIAEAIDMHESTVSRVTSNKYIATPRGVFELRYFFTTAINSADGGESHSSEAVRHRIRELIEGEKPTAILSDDRLSETLKSEGMDIARRTVAKYREAMHIPTSAQRRRDKRG